MACSSIAARGQPGGRMTFTGTLTSSLACFTVFLPIRSAEGNKNRTVYLHCQLLFCTWFSRLSRWNTLIVLGNGFLFAGSLRCFSASVRSVRLWRKQSMRVSNLHVTALHCALGEISPWHTHLQWAPLLIRIHPGYWLALLFGVQATVTNTDRQTHTHTHLRLLLYKLTSSL